MNTIKSLLDLCNSSKHENITYRPIIISAMEYGGSSTLAMNPGALGGLSMKLPVKMKMIPRVNVSAPVINQK